MVTFKAIGNCDDSQLSSQLPIVSCLLLVDGFESCNFVLGLLEFLSELSGSHVNSGDKPKGCGPDGGTDGWVNGER